MLKKQKKPFEKKFLKNSVLSFYGQIPINVKNGFFKNHFFKFFEQNWSEICLKRLQWPCLMLRRQKKPFEKKFLKNSTLSFYGQIPINVKKRFFRNSLFCFFRAKWVENMSQTSQMAMFYAKKTKKTLWKKNFWKIPFCRFMDKYR